MAKWAWRLMQPMEGEQNRGGESRAKSWECAPVLSALGRLMRKSYKLNKGYILFYVCVLRVSTYVHHVCAWCPWRQEEGIGSAGSELRTVGSHYVSIWNYIWVFCKTIK